MLPFDTFTHFLAHFGNHFPNVGLVQWLKVFITVRDPDLVRNVWNNYTLLQMLRVEVCFAVVIVQIKFGHLVVPKEFNQLFLWLRVVVSVFLSLEVPSENFVEAKLGALDTPPKLPS